MFADIVTKLYSSCHVLGKESLNLENLPLNIVKPHYFSSGIFGTCLIRKMLKYLEVEGLISINPREKHNFFG
jgi:hypothetical protein